MAKIEDALSGYNQSNFDITGAANAMRTLGAKYGLTEDQLAQAVPVFGDEHRKLHNSGYTEGSNYNAIAQRAVQDALKTAGKDPNIANDASYIETGRQQAQQRWQDTQKDDDSGFGSLVMMAVTAVAAAYGVPLWVTSAAKAGLSLASGADPLDAIVNGGLSYLSGNVLQGLSVDGAGIGGSDFVGDLPVDPSAGSPAIGTGDGNVFASADTETMNDASVIDGPVQIDSDSIVDPTGSGASTVDTVNAENAFTQGGGYQPGGIIDSVLKFANENQTLTGGMVSGALGVVGGIGSALLNKSTAEKKMEADKELLSQKTVEDLKAAENKRAMIQSGSYFDSKLGVSAPQATRQLRRPDGTLVYAQPGLITGQMNQPPR